MTTATADWREQIFETLKGHDLRQVYYVPDAGHSKLIEACQNSNSMRAIVLTTEEEAMAGTLGAWLGGEKSGQANRPIAAVAIHSSRRSIRSRSTATAITIASQTVDG